MKQFTCGEALTLGAFGLAFGLGLGFGVGLAFGGSEATRNIELEAVRKGRAEWKPNEHGAPVFRWKGEGEK